MTASIARRGAEIASLAAVSQLSVALGSAMILLLVCVCCVPILLSAAANRQLPNMTSIDGEFTAKLAVDNFFSLWIVFNNEDVTMSGKVLLLIVSFFCGGRLITHIFKDIIQRFFDIFKWLNGFLVD